jgi:hypothetical protein
MNLQFTLNTDVVHVVTKLIICIKYESLKWNIHQHDYFKLWSSFVKLNLIWLSKMVKFSKLIVSFLDVSSIHGLKYLSSPRSNRLEKYLHETTFDFKRLNIICYDFRIFCAFVLLMASFVFILLISETTSFQRDNTRLVKLHFQQW